MYCIGRRQYQNNLNILFGDVSVAQLVASMSGVVLGGGVETMFIWNASSTGHQI